LKSPLLISTKPLRCYNPKQIILTRGLTPPARLKKKHPEMTKQFGRYRTKIISALCTPLNEDESLNAESLAMHIEDQVQAGFAGLLVGGSMGLMQLLCDQTYRDLIEQGVRANNGRLEMLVGVGDTSFARTRDRIDYVQQFKIDGIVVLTPSWWKFSKDELIQYFTDLANYASKPIYLYDLPGLTGVSIDVEMMQTLADHPNIAGIKCSGAWQGTRQLMGAMAGRVRVIPAQPLMMDQLIRLGVEDNLDGIYSIFPELTVKIIEAAESNQWAEAEQLTHELSELLLVLISYRVMPAALAILNARGIYSATTPRPVNPLSKEKQEKLLKEPAIAKYLGKFNG